MEWLEALVLGVVQGVTEFLPVSSDGHLLITQQAFAWLTGQKKTGEENLFFDVMLHVGTLVAILIYYRAVVKTGAKGLLGSEEVPPTYRRAAVIRTGLLAAVATTPLIPLALFLKKWIEKTFESTAAGGIGFLITAGVLLLTTKLQNRGEGGKGPAETTYLDALAIGVAQMFAPLPGVSRSGLTVATALGVGLSRSWAVGFSLLIAVPAILGATVLEVRKVNPELLTGDRMTRTAAAAALAGLVGYGAIIWLVKIVRSGRLWYFSVYLVVLGLSVLLAASMMDLDHGAKPDAGGEAATDGAVRRGGEGAPPAGGEGSELRPVDRADAPRPDAGAHRPRPSAGARTVDARLVLVRPLAGRS